jgi:hypothetical protein
MSRIAALSTGTKLVLGAGLLLLVDLFLTWQAVPVDFGRNGEVTKSLDGWDFWGLVIGLLTLVLLAITAIREYDYELGSDPRWDRITFALGVLVLAVAVLKNLRDSDSTWASYLGVLLAALVAVGTYLDWSRPRERAPREPVFRASPMRVSERALAARKRAEQPRPKW